MSKKNIPLFWPNIYKEEWLEELEKIFSTRWLGEGPKTKEFEAEFGKKFGYKYCLSVNSGTAALELAYHLIGIKKGDKVITSVMTCSATNIPLLRRKARIVFADVERDTFTMDFLDFKKKLKGPISIEPYPKAIVTVNLSGIPCDPEIYSLAKEHNIPVVVDACQSLGISELYGDYIVYSFQAIKHFTTFDGGMLVLRNEKDYIRAKKLRWFGIDREAKAKNEWKCLGSDRSICMDVEEAGYKFHMNDIAATMGLVGLKHNDEALKHRWEIAKVYSLGLDPKIVRVFGGSCWLFCILSEERENLTERLRARGVECDPVHLRNDVFTVFGVKWALKNMDWIEPRYLYIPIHNNMSIKDAEYVVKVINEEFNE